MRRSRHLAGGLARRVRSGAFSNLMPLWLQHTLALLIVAGALLVVLRQLLSFFRGRKSRLGSCCAKGCTPPEAANSKSERVVFLPVEMLARRGPATKRDEIAK